MGDEKPGSRSIWLWTLSLCLALSVSSEARAQDDKDDKKAWVSRSNALAQILVEAQAPFDPETFSFFGIARYDDQVIDLRHDREARFRAATLAAKTGLQKALRDERDPDVRQDLDIMIAAAARSIAESELNERLMLTYRDVPELLFSGINDMLAQQISAERRPRALTRLQRYVGLIGDSTPVATLARQHYEQRARIPGLVRPTRRQIEAALAKSESYIKGIRDVISAQKLAGSEPALAAMEQQLRAYSAWTRETVLPGARSDTQLPAEIYAQSLRSVGIDIPAQVLIQRAQLEFAETRAALQLLAARVASEKRLPARDYRDVIRALKREKIPNERLEQTYRRVIDAIDPIIRRERIVEVPQRPLAMRLASEAESASAPAPYLLVPPLWENHGEQATFVLTLSNPSPVGKPEVYDDFNYQAVCWTLSAHEARPGHELQNLSMVEHGVSFARSAFAFNSVNVEGWALYAEAELIPYEPADAQLIALQFRLLRAARAMLDPLLNLGMIDREHAERVLLDEVVVSPAMARQELDRYMFLWPGQAGSYFFGYSRIMQLRVETELALAPKFDRFAFNNFILAQGMVPPALLAKAVRERFVPAARASEPEHTHRKP